MAVMAMLALRPFSDIKLDITDSNKQVSTYNHIIEPEFHQGKYVDAVVNASKKGGAFRLSDEKLITRVISRGKQPEYADDESDPDTLMYEGMMLSSGARLDAGQGKRPVCALKSNCVRQGFIDFDLARSVSRNFYKKVFNRAGVQSDDLLINSTGDGTIGRVAVYNKSFPAVADGHITIVRLKSSDLAWYTAAYLMSEEGQYQLYRYINGSSGQVEIYPQDIARIWIPGGTPALIKRVANSLRAACLKHDEFFTEMTKARAFFT